MAKTYTFNLTPYGAKKTGTLSATPAFDTANSAKQIGFDISGSQYVMYGVGLSGSVSVVGTVSSISLKVNFNALDATKKKVRIGKKNASGTSSYTYTDLSIDSPEVVRNDTTFTVNLTSKGICPYGYFLWQSDYNTYSGNKMVITSAVLTINTNANDYSYTLAYNANNGSGAPGNQTGSNVAVSPSYTFTISSTKPTRAGYQFLGWSTSSTATSASYSSGGSITVTQSGTTTLYAVWKLLATVRIVNSSSGLDTYRVYVVNSAGTGLDAYRVMVVNSAGTGLDTYT